MIELTSICLLLGPAVVFIFSSVILLVFHLKNMGSCIFIISASSLTHGLVYDKFFLSLQQLRYGDFSSMCLDFGFELGCHWLRSFGQ